MPAAPSAPRPQINAMAGRRFLVVGLPRSGTTYLSSLLNDHAEIYSSGEQFNPYSIVHEDTLDFDAEAVLGRDRTPLRYMDAFFARAETLGVARAGFKFMIGHNVRVLRHLQDYPDLKLIYVWRENKLAQVSSYLKALQTKQWSQLPHDKGSEAKLDVGPRRLSHVWHEFSTYDFLFKSWLATQGHAAMTVEYRQMFAPDFNAKVCAFLGVDEDRRMKSPLVKQNRNTILDRFKHPAPIAKYFRDIGCGHWLEPEL